MSQHHDHTGPIAFMARHRVAANILMIILLLGGLFFAYSIKKEVFPETDLDMVTVSVSYSGATPEETEQGIVLPIEEAIDGIEGIEEVSSSAGEGSGSVSIELDPDQDRMRIYQEIQQKVDAITTFPDEAERPQVSINQRKRHVLSLMLYGAQDAWALREYGERLRDRILSQPKINQVELEGVLDYEVRVEVDQEALERYGVTLKEISQAISSQSLELSGGTVKSEGGEILVRLDERRDYAQEFARLPIFSSAQGRSILLSEVATVTDGFDDSDYELTFNGKQSISVEVYRTGDSTPIEVSKATREAMEEFKAELPDGMEIVVRNDSSEIYEARLELLLKNGFIGLLLIVVLLGAFLEFRLAFWVAVGIPTSFLGAFLFLPWMDVSVNMVSMFAFIVALGIVVDDAIIAGENIYEFRSQGMGYLEAGIEGAKDIAVPLTFAIITNIVAFSPLAFVPGMMGKLFLVIPIVVGTVFVLSWIEALFILPHHLAYSEKTHSHPLSRFLYENQQKVAKSLDWFIEKVYQPVLRLCLRYRYITVASGIAVLLLVLAYAQSGRLGFEMMPRVESDRAVAYGILPVDATMKEATKVRDRIIKAGLEAVGTVEGDLMEGYRARISSNEVRVDFYLLGSEERAISTAEFNRRWREACGPIPGVDTLKFRSDIGGPGGGQASISIELAHRDTAVLEKASALLADRIRAIQGTKDIEDGFTPGKPQYTLTVTPYGRSLGLSSSDIASQVRASLNGTEALRQLRGRNEVKVRLYLPENQRDGMLDLFDLPIRTTDGVSVPLRSVAHLESGHSYTTISRRDGRRTVSVEANAESAKELTKVTQTIDTEVLPEIRQLFPGLSAEYQGRQADMKEGMTALIQTFVLVLVVIYITLALPFQSYTQPVIVMVAIPFGIVGAFLGHALMGYSLSVISVMGIVALSGVVINDTLVLVDYANRQRRKGTEAYVAIVSAGMRRFRPILLTTVTTFGGLAPMIFETSIQAKFLIPMALSLGYGIVFATFITLILIPALYLILEDVQKLFKKKPQAVPA